jgi:exodeoxyribonuclease VII large subunit
VIRDILHRLAERFPRRVLLWPVLVQGEQAAGQVAAAIRGFNGFAGDLRPDVIIVARGGGSIEDLWAFNEEIVVRAAAESVIPLISAVGHETDTTLIDFAADLRAPTPTGAAEKAVPVRSQLIEQVEGFGGRLSGGLLRGMERRRTELRAAGARLPRPETLLAFAQQRFDRAAERLGFALQANTRAAAARFDRVGVRLRAETLIQAAARRGERLRELDQRLIAAVNRGLADDTRRLRQTGRLLETLSHKSVLARGFALVTDEAGAVVRSAAALSAGDAVKLSFADGAAPAVIGTGEGRKKPKPAPAQGSLF